MKKLLACFITILLLVGVFGIGIHVSRDVPDNTSIIDSALEYLCPMTAYADTSKAPLDPPAPPDHE